MGREIARHRDYSEKTAQLIDDEVRSIVERAEARATALLTKNIEQLHLLAKALLEHESLDGEDIDKLLAGEELPRSVAATYK